MTTALEIIERAMKKCGALTKSETPDADESNDALVSLNNLLSSWSNESISVYARTTESFSLVAGTSSYTIGVGQTFNTARPIFIADAYIRYSTLDYPVDVINDETYDSISDKSARGRPTVLNYTAGNPSGTIRLWNNPDQVYTLYIVSEKELGQLTLSSTVDLPPGWERALIYNLAVELAPEYGQQPDQLVYNIAVESKRMINSAVMRNRSLDATMMLTNTGNILSGYRG